MAQTAPASRAEEIDTELLVHADPERAAREKGYLKSDLVHYGVPVPVMHAVTRRVARPLARGDLLDLAEHLWDEPASGPVFERRFLTADLLARRADLLSPADLPLLERLCRQARTWAIIDTLAPHVLGPLAERHPDELTPALDAWSTDPDFWMRRTVLLTHLVPLRKGGGDWLRFTRYAEVMLGDREFFVAKALGWVLRDTGRRRPELVLAWLEPRISQLSAVTVREALKPLDPEDQERLQRRRPSRTSRK